MKNNLQSSILICLILSVFSCTPTNSLVQENDANNPQVTTQINPLLGSWKMNAVHWITSDTTYSIDNAQEGLFLFTPNSYSIMWTPTEEPRVAFVDLSKPTDDELKAGFRSVVFNGGSYEITDSTLTTTAYIAKVPGFESGIQYYRYSITNNLLRLTMFDETYPNGDKPAWSGRYVTEFVMTRVKN